MSNKKLIVTPEFVINYPKVFQPEVRTKADGTEFEMYEFKMMIPKETEFTELKEAISEAAVSAFGKLAKNAILKDIMTEEEKKKLSNNAPNLACPVRDGDLSKKEVEHGYWVLKCKTSYPPIVIDMKGNHLGVENSHEIYPGCICQASVSCKGYIYKGEKRGVTLYFRHLLKVRDGEKIHPPVSPFTVFGIDPK